MKTVVLYSSLTGNTKRVAEAIYESIPYEKQIYKVNEDTDINKYDVVAIGYWVNKGICDEKVKQIIESVSDKKIILFGTLGASENSAYYESIKKRVENLVPQSNKVLGHFLCQGKINEKLTETYKQMLIQNPQDEDIKEQIKNHKQASTHPDAEDILNAKKFINNIFGK